MIAPTTSENIFPKSRFPNHVSERLSDEIATRTKTVRSFSLVPNDAHDRPLGGGRLTVVRTYIVTSSTQFGSGRRTSAVAAWMDIRGEARHIATMWNSTVDIA